MKKILMLITILIMAIASCSSPTLVTNNGGGSDVNDNINTNPPEIPDNGGDNGDGGDNGNGGDNGDSNTGGDNGNGGGSTGGDNNNNGGVTPPTEPEKPAPPVQPEQPVYKGVANRIPNKDVIGKIFEGSYYTDGWLFRKYEIKINQDGLVELWITAGDGSKIRYWSHKVGINKDNDINDSSSPITKFRFVGYSESNKRFMLVEVIFDYNYTVMKAVGTQEAIYDFFIQQNQEWWWDQKLAVKYN